MTLPRTGLNTAPLTVSGTEPNGGTGKLELKYLNNVTGVANDKLIYFSAKKANAEASDYMPELGGFAVLANKSTGYIYLGNVVTVQTVGGTAVYYPSVAKAMEAIGTGNSVYTVTVRKENYEMTAADGIAVATHGKNAQKIIFTSKFTIVAADPMEQGEAVGKSVVRNIVVGAGATASDPKADLSFVAPVVAVEGMHLNYRQEGCAIYAGGNALTIGPAVEVNSDAAYYPAVYGGAKDGSVARTSLTLLSGRYSAIYGGGREAGADVTGSTHVAFEGDAELYGPMYGGGEAGDVGGNTEVLISGGQAMAHDETLGTVNTMVAGGKSGVVGGNAAIRVTKGNANGTVNLAGVEDGAVVGDVTLSITNNPDDPAPTAEQANLYGAALPGESGTVGGNISITIQNGKFYGTIDGGRSQLTNHTTQKSEITLAGGTLTVNDIQDFDELNLGVAAQSGPGLKTTLTLTGALRGKDGNLNFWSDSVLTLRGKSKNVEDLIVNNLHTDDSSTRSHLHIFKTKDADGTAVSRPLTVRGANTSLAGATTDKLVVGVFGDTGVSGAQGDHVLHFQQAGKADINQYLSDNAGLDIIQSTAAGEEGVLMLGITSSPSIVLEKVQHVADGNTPAAPERPGETTNRTLNFLIKSYREGDDRLPGNPIHSAYVSSDMNPDQTWITTGTLPATATPIAVTQNGTDSVEWTGTVTMPITARTATVEQFYFVHVKDITNTVRTIVVDINAPELQSTPAVTKTGAGDYTFEVKLKDIVPGRPDGAIGADITYTASGIKQIAWALGDTSGPAAADEALQETLPAGGSLHDVTDLNNVLDDHSYKLTVPADMLGDTVADKVVYVYAKDALGNTSVIAIPLSDNLIDVTVPLRAGVIALRGGNAPQVVAPTCYIVNHSGKRVKAEIIGAEFAPGPLTLVSKSSGFAADELNLRIKAVPDGLGENFLTRSVSDSLSATRPLLLGTMPAGTEANHGVSFTFDAAYNHLTIPRTNGWTPCVLSYRFTLVQ